MNIFSTAKAIVADTIREIKRQRAIKDAKQRIQFDIFGKNIEKVEAFDHPEIGYVQVVLSDDHVTVASGSFDAPGAYATYDKVYIIVVNRLALESEYYPIIIQHEIGHFVHGHQPSPTADAELRRGVGLAVENEYAADDYATSRGYDIKSVLIWLRDSYGFDGVTVRQRIERL